MRWQTAEERKANGVGSSSGRKNLEITSCYGGEEKGKKRFFVRGGDGGERKGRGGRRKKKEEL